jgi:cysteine desulfurase
VAESLRVDLTEVIFTSGATESNNLAIQGFVNHFVQANPEQNCHLIATETEHKSVLNVLSFLEAQYAQVAVTLLKPDTNGMISPAHLEKEVNPDTRLFACHWVNNELGVAQDVKALSSICNRHSVAFHLDAAQALGKIALNLDALSFDSLSLSAHKAYGPKGAGVLVVKENHQSQVQPMLLGGPHEVGLRAGTLATHQIVGTAQACIQACAQLNPRQDKAFEFKTALVSQLSAALEPLGWVIRDNSPLALPSYLNFRVSHSSKTCRNDSLIQAMPDLAMATGSACNSKEIKPSYVLKAIGLSDAEAQASFRLSFGDLNALNQIDPVVAHFTAAIKSVV